MLQKSTSDEEGAASTNNMDGSNRFRPELVCKTDNNAVILLITANVGSLFEDPERLLNPWLAEFFDRVEQLQPHFVALHLQEVGGKTYEKSTESVKKFIQCICNSTIMLQFSSIRVYIDEDYNSAQHFTALGNLYFGNDTLCRIRIWNFMNQHWEQADESNIYAGNIEQIPTKEKSKFPQHFFPECKWSRKGYMRTRWEINGTVIDLVNIHLFHDASNLAACDDFPSVYCKTRRRALVHTIERFHTDESNCLVPFFIFGDFNFRCDTQGVIKELTQNLSIQRVQGIKKDSTKIHYKNDVGDNILTVGKKEFLHADHQFKFKGPWLKKYDHELDVLKGILEEFEIKFPPSYPYEEDPDMPTDYMSTRCPSWCDRILMSPQISDLIDHDNINSYNIMGENICMGDHKPVYLNIQLKSNQGTYRCCKCCLNVNNMLTSCNDPAATTLCPYKIAAFNEILVECTNLHTGHVYPHIGQKCQNVEDQTKENNVSRETFIDQKLSNINGGVSSSSPISINVINSENSLVSWYSQIVNNDSDTDYKNRVLNCSKCSNNVNEPMKHSYRQQMSKQLLLSNEIIVNQIDTQYLNTVFEMALHCQDPYTPESLESHSPLPELNSFEIDNSVNIPAESNNAFDIEKGKDNHNVQKDSLSRLEQPEKQHRGVVTPRQLKSRLESLQMYSVNSTTEANSAAGASYIGDIDDINQNTSTVHLRHSSSCLPKCCNIN